MTDGTSFLCHLHATFAKWLSVIRFSCDNFWHCAQNCLFHYVLPLVAHYGTILLCSGLLGGSPLPEPPPAAAAAAQSRAEPAPQRVFITTCWAQAFCSDWHGGDWGVLGCSCWGEQAGLKHGWSGTAGVRFSCRPLHQRAVGADGRSSCCRGVETLGGLFLFLLLSISLLASLLQRERRAEALMFPNIITAAKEVLLLVPSVRLPVCWNICDAPHVCVFEEGLSFLLLLNIVRLKKSDLTTVCE